MGKPRIQQGLLRRQHFQISSAAVFHQKPGALCRRLQRSDLLVVKSGFLTGSLVLDQRFIDLHAGIQQGLFKVEARLFLLRFRNLQLGYVRSFIEQRLCQGSHGGSQEFPRIDNHAPRTVGPSRTPA